MRTVTACLALLIAGAQSNAAIACSGEPKPLSSEGVDLGWVQSTLTIYGVDDKNLYEARLNSTERKRLVALDREFSGGLVISPDARFLLYSTSRDESLDDSVDHLFDRSSGTNRIVPVLPKPEDTDYLVRIGFSPDSKWLAWQSNQNGSTQDSPESHPALIVFDTVNLATKELAYPSFGKSTGPKHSCFTSAWGTEGHSIYSNYLDTGDDCALDAKGGQNLVYFKTDAATGKVTRVDGGYTFDKAKTAFGNYYVDAGVTLRLTRPCNRAYGCVTYGQRVVAGTSQAWLHHVSIPGGPIDGEEELFVQRASEPPHKIDSGWTSSCSGTNIEIIGWVEDGKYLIYQREGNTYLFGVEEHKSSPLPQLTGTYDWLPIEVGGRTTAKAERGPARMDRK